MAKIYLVRHAESVANSQGIYQGVTFDTPLSERGKKQAQTLAEYFAHVSLSHILASPLKRTMQTAAYVAKSKKLPVVIEKQIIETNHGDWEGKHKDTIKNTWPWICKKWQRFPSTTKFPDGERFLETQNRVTAWWKIFSQSVNEDTLIVSHDNIIRVIVAKILNMKLNKIWKFHLQPTAITKVSVSKETIVLENLGDSKHLGALEVDLSMHAL